MRHIIFQIGVQLGSIGARLAVAVVLLSLATACKGKRAQNSAENCPHDIGLRTSQEWRHEVAFPYTASEGAVHRIIANYDHVVVGSSKSNVTSALGPPDFEEELY